MTPHPKAGPSGSGPAPPSPDGSGTHPAPACLVLGCLGLAVGGIVLVAVIVLPLVAALLTLR